MQSNDSFGSPRDHGRHTLEVLSGVVVGIDRKDVFVELSPRHQGVIALDAFDHTPALGEQHEFVLHGREESLWILSLAGSASLASWENAEPGQLLGARVLRLFEEGYQLKSGRLHAWMPRSQSGLPRGHDPEELVGRTVQVEVLEVDPRHQRVIVSRKSALRHLQGTRLPVAGSRVQGRIVRVEEYGAFVQLSCGRQGLVHVSNIAHEPIIDAREALREGQAVEALVLSVREGGRRIALGLKQLIEHPFALLARSAFEGQLLEGTVAGFLPGGALIRVAEGVMGFLPEGQGDTDQPLRRSLRFGQGISVRILRLDPEAERLTLSLRHSNGRPIGPEEASLPRDLGTLAAELGAAPPGTNLGSLLRRALG